MKNIFILFLTLFLTYSCSFFIKYSSAEFNKKEIKLKNSSSNYILTNNRPIFFLSYESNATLKQILELTHSHSYNLLENFYLWAIVQLHTRPDMASPSARLQVVLRKNKQYFCFDFRPNDLFHLYKTIKKIPKPRLNSHSNSMAELQREIRNYKLEVEKAMTITNSKMPSTIHDTLIIPDIEDFDIDESLFKELTKITTDTNKKTQDIKNQSFISMPYLFGLNYLIKNFSPNSNLLSLDNKIHRFFENNSTFVTPDFHSFLSQYQSNLSSVDVFKKGYFNEDDPLFVHEQLPSFSYLDIIDKFKVIHKNPLTSILYNIPQKLYPHQNFSSALCTIESQSKQRKQKNSSDSNQKSIVFGILQNNSAGDFIVASAAQDNSSSLSLFDTPLMLSQRYIKGMDYCYTNDWLNFTLPSFSSSEILYQSYAFSPKSSYSIEDLMEYFIKSARFLHMDDPKRLIIETNRLEESQVNELYKKNPLLYSKIEMGEIWNIYHFANSNETGIIMDPRTNPNIRGQHWAK